jgi:uncharacterized cupin superfamily protein
MWDRSRPHATRSALFGGRGSVRVWDALGASAAGSVKVVLACELEPGGSVGRHLQQELDEVVIVIDGHGRIVVDGAAVDVTPGTAVPLALGQVLSIENGSSDAPLRYLIVKALPAR